MDARIPSQEIPQADRIDLVGQVALAVSAGAQSDEEIGDALGGYVDRQGRYYRLAARLIGLVDNQSNVASLTQLGKEFVAADAQGRHSILTDAALSLRLFQRIIALLEASPNGVSTEDLTAFMSEMTGRTVTTSARRRSTVTSWLLDLGLVTRAEGRFFLVPGAPSLADPLEIGSTAEPLFPRTFELTEYETVSLRASAAREHIEVLISAARAERADNAHRQLVNLVASRLSRTGKLAKTNRLIDLAAEVDVPVLFEMKSIAGDNARVQIRAGVSQLYEYRYLQSLPDARLVLVTETAPPDNTRWMTDYLEKDRGIYHVWDGDGNLYASDATKEVLSFLWA